MIKKLEVLDRLFEYFKDNKFPNHITYFQCFDYLKYYVKNKKWSSNLVELPYGRGRYDVMKVQCTYGLKRVIEKFYCGYCCETLVKAALVILNYDVKPSNFADLNACKMSNKRYKVTIEDIFDNNIHFCWKLKPAKVF